MCSFWLCGSIVLYPVIYRLIPSPFQFEIRQLKKIKFELAESNCSILHVCQLSSKYMYLLLLWVCAMLMFVCPNIQQNLRSIPPAQNNRYKNNFSYSNVEVNQHSPTEINNQRMQTTTYRTCLSPLKKQEELRHESYLIVIILWDHSWDNLASHLLFYPMWWHGMRLFSYTSFKLYR